MIYNIFRQNPLAGCDVCKNIFFVKTRRRVLMIYNIFCQSLPAGFDDIYHFRQNPPAGCDVCAQTVDEQADAWHD